MFPIKDSYATAPVLLAVAEAALLELFSPYAASLEALAMDFMTYRAPTRLSPKEKPIIRLDVLSFITLRTSHKSRGLPSLESDRFKVEARKIMDEPYAYQEVVDCKANRF